MYKIENEAKFDCIYFEDESEKRVVTYLFKPTLEIIGERRPVSDGQLTILVDEMNRLYTDLDFCKKALKRRSTS